MKKNLKIILELLDEHYPTEDKCYLNYEKAYELLFATIMSAQCTDAQVNMVTEVLFVKYPNLESFAGAELLELELDIKPTGFYHVKAKNIRASAQMLLNEFGGTVPSDLESLLKLPGVGRKTANLVLGHIFGIPGIVVDTHVKRISQRLGLTKNTDPEKIEYDLMAILPKEHWIRYNTQIIAHGRGVCRARGPMCGECFLNSYCPFFGSQGAK